jgi:hypothetical protein
MKETKERESTQRLTFMPDLEDGPEEQEIGTAGGWRFVIRPDSEGNGWCLWKKSLSALDHGRQIILEAGNKSEEECRRIADKRITAIDRRDW